MRVHGLFYLYVVDHKFVESVGHHVTSLLVGAIANARHGDLPFEPSTHSVVNAFGFSPVWLQDRHTRRIALEKYIFP